MKFFYLIFLFLISFISAQESQEKIIFAWQINRHGARAPYLGVKDGIDIYGEKWTQIEELSDVGKRMLYLLGVRVRKRYVEKYGLLSQTYNPQEIYIRSTDVNRTIESIESFLQGLYPIGPTFKEKLLDIQNLTYPPNQNYSGQFQDVINKYHLNDGEPSALPFNMSVQPVHLFYRPAHEFELYNADLCKGHKEGYLERQKRDEVKRFGDNLLTKFPYFQELENSKNKTFIQDYWTIYKYMDGFVCDETDQRDFTLLKEKYSFNETQRELLKNFSKEFLWMDYLETNYPKDHPEISITAMSYTMHSLVNWMEKAIEGNKDINSYIKYVIYSAHDSSIGALESFMNYAFDLEVEYATFAETRYFELYYNPDDIEEKSPRVRYIKGNNEIKKDMSFEEFKKVIKEKAWTDEKVGEFCKFNEEEEDDDDKKALILTLILSGIDFILFIALILIFFLKHKN